MNLRKLAAALLGLAAFSLPLAASADAADADAWGAIAVNLETNQVGLGFGETTENKAQREADRDCPGKCRQIIIVRNKCGALGVTSSGRYVGGFDSKKRPAIAKARKKLDQGGKILAFVCSG
ncbi:MAG: DUF4189 domain-containing protein [Solirubrobacterales bacterium]